MYYFLEEFSSNEAVSEASSHSSEVFEEPSRMTIGGFAQKMRTSFNKATQPERPRAQTGLTDLVEKLAIEENPDTVKAHEL